MFLHLLELRQSRVRVLRFMFPLVTLALKDVLIFLTRIFSFGLIFIYYHYRLCAWCVVRARMLPCACEVRGQSFGVSSLLPLSCGFQESNLRLWACRTSAFSLGAISAAAPSQILAFHRSPGSHSVPLLSYPCLRSPRHPGLAVSHTEGESPGFCSSLLVSSTPPLPSLKSTGNQTLPLNIVSLNLPKTIEINWTRTSISCFHDLLSPSSVLSLAFLIICRIKCLG